MIRIALVEDDPAYAEQLLSYLKEYEKESKERISVQTFSDGEDIVTEYRADYDIILMDVEMKFMDGMSAAEEIRKMDTEVVIIFITNMPQYAIQGYRVDALDYVLKTSFLFCVYAADRPSTDETEKAGEEISDDCSEGRYDEVGSFGDLLCGSAGS